MTQWGEAETRYDLWLRLMNVADELNYIAEQWRLHDLEFRELEDIKGSTPIDTRDL